MSAKTPALILVQAMDSGEFSDLKFVSNGEEFKVHKVIVCQQSPVIKAAIRGAFEESHTNAIQMDKFQPGTVKRMIQFMYTGDYDEPMDEYQASPDASLISDNEREEKTAEMPQFGSVEESDADSVSSETPFRWMPHMSMFKTALLEHIQVNSIGDYYGLDELVSLANTKVEALLQRERGSESWVAASLPAATEAAVKSTGDKELLDILARSMEKNILKIQDWDQFEEPDILTDFSVKVLKNCATTIQSLTSQLKSSKLQRQREIMDLKEEIVTKDTQIRGKEAHTLRMMLALEKMKQTQYCRNTTCDAEFQSSIDPIECILRCKKCRCKHS